MIKISAEDCDSTPRVRLKAGESESNARFDNTGTPNLGPCPLPNQKPSFEWFFVSEVIASGTTADQLLRLWEQGEISMWVTLPSGAYFLPDNARYYHIEQFGPVQISSEALPDMANYGEARIRLVATPPKYDEKWRMINAGQLFELPDPPLIKFERLRIIHSDFANIVALETFAELAAECEGTLDKQDRADSEAAKPQVGRKRTVPTNAQTEADRIACELYNRTGNESPTKKQICNALSKAHGGSSTTWQTRFSVANCHNAIKRYEEQKERK